MIKKFTSKQQAEEYIKALKYSFVEDISYKNTRAKLYRKGGLRAMLNTEYDYLNNYSMDMGTIYIFSTWNRY
tara:strand:+ start:2903 stop:3118 length:216 start_codon:yes stop_codon:yes gene_type:complete